MISFRTATLFDERLRPLLRPVEPALEQLLMIDRLRDAFESAIACESGGSVFGRLLAQLDIGYSAATEDLARIPDQGPAVLVANHPFGFLEGVILGAVLPQVRPDVRFMANSLLAAVPQLDGLCIFVNPFGGRQAMLEKSGRNTSDSTRHCCCFGKESRST